VGIFLSTLLAFSIAGAALPALQAPGVTTVIVVRHAERASSESDSPLSAAGRERARALAHMLRDTPLRAIITSQYARTKETAEPTAMQKQITPEAIAGDNVDAVIDRIRQLAGGTILVVHHSNTVPAIVDKLGARGEPIADNEYDRLTIVTLTSNGATALTLRYDALVPR
jgi:broad specificity phosphatase PhoE